MITIYALVEPGTETPKYIGQSVDPEARYKNHIASGRQAITLIDEVKSLYYKPSPKEFWIMQHLRSGTMPELMIIEECDDSIAKEREFYWINYYLNQGIYLTNTTMPKGIKRRNRDWASAMRRWETQRIMESRKKEATAS